MSGRALGGSTLFLVNGQIFPATRYLTAGNPQALQGEVAVLQAQIDGAWKLITCDTDQPYAPPIVVSEEGQTHLFAGAGVWYAKLNGYRDSRGKYEPSWAPVAADNRQPRCAVATDAGLQIWDHTRLTPIDGVPDSWEKGDVHFSDGVLGYRRGGQILTWGRNPPVQVRGQGVRFSGDWLLTFQAGRGTVIHPWDSPTGLVLSTDEQDFNPDIRDLGDGRVTVVSSTTQGDEDARLYFIDTKLGTVNGIRREWIDLRIEPAESLPAIGRPLWLGWFTFTRGAQLPANCDFHCGTDTDGYVRTMNGTQIAKYVAASNDSDVDELEAFIRSAKRQDAVTPVLAYWTRQAQRQRPPAGADILGVEAYCGVDEALSAFEARIRTAGRGRRRWLIGQAYTSNATLTADLRSLVPVFARVLREEDYEGALIFSGSGRATGYQDHPEIQPLWSALMAGIPRPPSVLPTPDPPQPSPSPEPTPSPVPTPPATLLEALPVAIPFTFEEVTS